MGTIGRRGLLGLALGAWAGAAVPGLAAKRAAGAATDLTGAWTNAWYTKMERPRAFKTLVVTPAEAEAYEKPRRAHAGELLDPEHDVLGQAESEFPENGPGLARIRGEIRSSWITDPPDGRIPWTAAAKKRLHIGQDWQDDYDNVETIDTDERCLTNGSGAAPLINSHDANLLQIVQTPDAVILVGEKNHEPRIILIARPGGPDPTAGALPAWTGVSVGHWEGRTLVAVTTRLRPGDTKIDDGLYLTDRARVTERFTRTGPHEIAYVFEVEDPNLFTQAWRGEQVLRTPQGRMFEYACHEGNYALPGILAGARVAERNAKLATK